MSYRFRRYPIQQCPPEGCCLRFAVCGLQAAGWDKVRAIARVLKTFPEFNVRCDGHARGKPWQNNALLNKMSQLLADVVRGALLREGVENKIWTLGQGSSQGLGMCVKMYVFHPTEDDVYIPDVRAMTVEERKALLKALNGVRSVALSKWPKHSNANKFKGLRWVILRRIELIGFKIEEMVDPKNPIMVYSSKDLNYFGIVCHLGHRDIALLMVKSGSVDINGKDEYGQTPLLHASYKGMIEVVRALVEAGADLNQARESGATPLHTASYKVT